jgi:hypothetical protein
MSDKSVSSRGELGFVTPKRSHLIPLRAPACEVRSFPDVNDNDCVYDFNEDIYDESYMLMNTPTTVAIDSPSLLRPNVGRHQIASSWSTEMIYLKQTTTVFECVTCLRRIRMLLLDIDTPDRLKFCKPDFLNAVNCRKNSSSGKSTIYSPELMKEIISIVDDFFNENYFKKLPYILIQEIFMWLPIDDFAPVASVCKEWYRISQSDELWFTFYGYKFLRFSDESVPKFPSGTYLSEFRTRLADPHIGDRVEVAWRGKFRLEAADVYQGLAWWVAEVVDKHPVHGKYKIRYPGWESRWDEWVPRSRLRWAVDMNCIEQIRANDTVELWCIGANVPGAWLESTVKKVKGNKYCVGRVLSSGPLWVERHRLRPVKHHARLIENTNSPSSSTRGSFTDSGRKLLRSISSSFASITISNNDPLADDPHNINNSKCTIM